MTQRFFEDLTLTAAYAKLRPVHPGRIAGTVLSFLGEKYMGPLNICVDVGCGSGQSTGLYSPHFENVLSTDVSGGQIEHAKQGNFPTNVQFLVSPAEVIPLPDNSVQLINSAQACHWFDLPKFFKEADRVLCQNGIIALYGYSLPVVVHEDQETGKELNQLVQRYYAVETAAFRGTGLSELDNEYRNIRIPYVETCRHEFWSELYENTLEGFIRYLSTLSGFHNYQKCLGQEAGLQLMERLANEVRSILQSEAETRHIQLNFKRKYFVLMGRKNGFFIL